MFTYSVLLCFSFLQKFIWQLDIYYNSSYKRLFTVFMFTEIVSNIIAWCHVYRDCVK